MISLDAVVKRTKALADPTRLKLLRLLADDEFCNCELVELFDISQPAVSQHLAKLKTAGLVQSRREGQWIYYQLSARGKDFLNRGFPQLFAVPVEDIPDMSDEVEKLKRLDRVALCKEPASPGSSTSEEQSLVERVMFLCTGNACRSQMAEGFLRHLDSERQRFDVYSAGVEPQGVHPLAQQVMSEIGIDISQQTSDRIQPDLLETMDYVITLCADANDRCPATPPAVKRLHWPVADPATAGGSEDEVLQQFRSVRDQIERRVREFTDKNNYA